MLWLFLAIGMVIVFGTTIIKAARWVMDATIVAVCSLAGSILLAWALAADEVIQLALGTLGFIVISALLWGIRNRLRANTKLSPVSIVSAPTHAAREPNRRWFAGRQPARPPAWDRLTEAAPMHHARLAVAERSFERFRAQNAGRMFDMERHETLIMIDRRLPELIVRELDALEEFGAAARNQALTKLVDLVEELAADCERQLGNNSGSLEESSILRTHIERYLATRRTGWPR